MMIILILLAPLLAILLVAGLTDRVILFRDHRDFGWMIAGPSALVAGAVIAMLVHNTSPAMTGVIVASIAAFVSLILTVRNNGVLLALPFFIIKLALIVVLFALLVLAFGAVPVHSRRGAMAPIPSMLAFGMALLIINGQRVALRREGNTLMRGLQSLR